jgi:hypothetical protein
VQNNEKKIKRIVVWGLKKKYHTHRHIHQAFYKNAKKLGYETIWVEDEMKSQKYIRQGDLIIASEVQGKMIPTKVTFEDYSLPIRDDVKYCLHNYQDVFKKQLKQDLYINLQVYVNDSENSDIKIDTARYYNTKTRTLYQPWGTDLLPNEFKKPVYNKLRFVFWIGSVWNNSLNQGNLNEINKLKSVLRNRGIYFIKLRFIPDILNIFFIRHSRIAPAIAGDFQVNANYLPCRMFKNISYGQLGITNVIKFKDILGKTFVQGESIKEMVENSLNFSKGEYLERIKAQQDIIKNYTYKKSIETILSYLNN